MFTTRFRKGLRVPGNGMRAAAPKHWPQLIPLRTSHAALLTAWLCAWTSNAPGGESDLDADPWSAPLSAEALGATSQSGRPATAVATTPASPVETPSAEAPDGAATAAAIPLPVPTPTVSVSTDGRERSLILAIPLNEDRSAPEQVLNSVIYISGPLQSPGPFEFNAAADAQIPEPVIAFEPPSEHADEVSLAALGAIDEIARDSLAMSYPAKLEDIPLPLELDDAPLLPTRNSLSIEPNADVIWAPVAAEQHTATQSFEASSVLAVLQSPLSAQPQAPAGIAEPAAPDARAGSALPSVAQQLAKLDIAERLPGPPLAVAALAQVSAFDPSRTVQRFEVTGKSALSRPIIDDALKAFLGVERNDEQLQAARNALQRAHDVNGQRVKVVLGEQRERNGVAQLDVRELKRYSLRIAGELRYDPVSRRNVRTDVVFDHDEPLPNLILSRKLTLR